MTDHSMLRVRLLPVVVFAICAVLIAQVLRLQVFDPVVPAAARDGIPRVASVEAARGLITDRNGTVLARNTPRYRVALVPGDLPQDADARRAGTPSFADAAPGGCGSCGDPRGPGACQLG